MVQNYHAVPVSVEHEDPDDGRGTEHEDSALLGAKASSVGLMAKNNGKEGRATLISSVSNLANTIIGSGACTPALCYCYRLIISLNWSPDGQACSPSLVYVPIPSLYIAF